MDNPNEIRSFEKGKIEIANIGDMFIGRVTLELGWSWEKCVKPIAKTKSEAPHTGYMVPQSCDG